MAYSTTKIDNNRTSNSIALPPELSKEVWAKAVEESAIMRLAQKIDIPGRGLSIPVVTGDAEAAWVAESTEKHVGNATFGLKTMTPYKLAVIELFSNEFKRDLPALYAELVRRLPAAIAAKFDATVFHASSAPGTGFDLLYQAPAQSIAPDAQNNTYQQLVNALATLAAGGYDLTGFALSAQGRANLLGAVDGDGRPLFIPSAEGGNIGRILGAPVIKAQGAYKAGTASSTGVDMVPTVVGFAGDWSQARWGMVNDIEIAISDEATINDGTYQINLWQRNMFAVRVECELAFVCTDDDAFVQLTVPTE